MIRLSLFRIAAITCLIPLCSAQADEATARLEREFKRIAETSGGTMGIAAVHLPSGRAVYLNPDQSFPMASTYKVPIAVTLLHKVEKGELSMTKLIPIPPDRLAPGSGMIGHLLDDPGVVLSVVNLLELMLLISDNTASDLCLELSGGANAVTQRMRDIGIESIRVDRSTTQMIIDYLGIESAPDGMTLTRDQIEKRSKARTSVEKEAATAAFATDPRDTATPRAMAMLLEKILNGQALGGKIAPFLHRIMLRCETGEDRIKGFLPEDTQVAHKTGTIGGTTNDVGIMLLPDNAGEVVFVGFIRDSTLPVEHREPAIAHAARAAYDFFLFNR
jgi:beta-lactamase class A